MDDFNRRSMLQAAAASGLTLALASQASAVGQDDKKSDKPVIKTDRDCVLGAGMTEAEADCWATVAEAAGKFFELPQMHPMDKQEVASAIHVIQNKLLSRPTYRRYLELAKQRVPEPNPQQTDKKPVR